MKAKVISQLEALLKGVKTMMNTRTRSLCELDHKWCIIDQSMYNYINRSSPDKLHITRSQCHRLLKKESLSPSIYLTIPNLRALLSIVGELLYVGAQYTMKKKSMVEENGSLIS